jgi:hypothetical protein
MMMKCGEVKVFPSNFLMVGSKQFSEMTVDDATGEIETREAPARAECHHESRGRLARMKETNNSKTQKHSKSLLASASSLTETNSKFQNSKTNLNSCVLLTHRRTRSIKVAVKF